MPNGGLHVASLGVIGSLACACGDAGDSVASVGASDGNTAQAPASGEPAPAQRPADAAPQCVPGERRMGMTAAEGSSCICRDSGLWVCFGVSPERAIGGDASCRQQLEITQDACTMMWGACDDAHAYMVTCPRGVCLCIVDAVVVGELEPGTTCPADVQAANALCSWKLRFETL